MVDSWLDNICDGPITGVCFLDICKCFGTTDHYLLKTKVQYYGVDDNELQRFSDHSTNHIQTVCHNKELSDKAHITIEAPQGSVLSPVLFMLYINDISQNCDVGACNLYADNAVAYCDGTSVGDVQEKLNCISHNC